MLCAAHVLEPSSTVSQPEPLKALVSKAVRLVFMEKCCTRKSVPKGKPAKPHLSARHPENCSRANWERDIVVILVTVQRSELEVCERRRCTSSARCQPKHMLPALVNCVDTRSDTRAA